MVIMRSRAYRRHKAISKMRRRLSEDRNQHYDDLKCLCWTSPKVMAQFKEQPKLCSCYMCGNERRAFGRYHPTIQELRNFQREE